MPTVAAQESRSSQELRALARTHRELGERAVEGESIDERLKESWGELQIALDGVYRQPVTVTGLERTDRIHRLTNLRPAIGDRTWLPTMLHVDESEAESLIGREPTVVYYLPLDFDEAEPNAQPSEPKHADAASMAFMLSRNANLLTGPRPNLDKTPACIMPVEDLQWQPLG